MHHLTDRITHATVFVTPVMENWLEWEIAQWVHHEGSIRRPTAPWANDLTTQSALETLLLRCKVWYSGTKHAWCATGLGSILLSELPDFLHQFLFNYLQKRLKQRRLKKKNDKKSKTIQYTNFYKIIFLSIGQDKSKLQKQISKLLILTETAGLQ